MQLKIILCSIAFVCLLSPISPAFAQADISYSVSEIETELSNTKLLLNNYQEKKLIDINREYVDKRDSLVSDPNLSLADFNKKMEQLEQDKELQLRELLDQEQYELYKSYLWTN